MKQGKLNSSLKESSFNGAFVSKNVKSDFNSLVIGTKVMSE